MEVMTYISCKLICYELTVLPDTNHIWKEQNGGVFVDSISSWFGNICFNVTNLGGLSGWLTFMLSEMSARMFLYFSRGVEFAT